VSAGLTRERDCVRTGFRLGSYPVDACRLAQEHPQEIATVGVKKSLASAGCLGLNTKPTRGRMRVGVNGCRRERPRMAVSVGRFDRQVVKLASW
jgi:hypothetical protein